jgi:hypothetical protein
LAACGERVPPTAHRQVAHIDWREAGDPHHLLGGPIVFRVQMLALGPAGWSVKGSVTNRTTQPLRIVYAHEPAGHNAFGIVVGNPQIAPVATATHFEPLVPTLLRPGERWSGTFSGPDGVARGVLVHVQFGQFATLHADRFSWVTDHAYRVR